MNTLTTQPKSTSLGWLTAWIIASAVGLTIGFLATLPLLWSMWGSVERVIGLVPAQILGGVTFGLGIGAALGIAQWLVLRGREQNAMRWLVGSIVGGVVAGAVTMLITSQNEGGENVMWTAIAFTTLGAILGAGQFLAARSIARNPLWIVASAVGLGIGATFPFLSTTQDLTILNVAIAGIFYGAVTGAAMYWFTKS